MSVSASVASRSWDTDTGHPSRLGGSSGPGATSVTDAPTAVNPSTLERATREWRMSPTMVTFLPARPPSRVRAV